MPGRLIPLVTGQYYHIYNRGVNKRPIFFTTWDYKRALELLHYYSFFKPRLRFSKYHLLNEQNRQSFWDEMGHSQKLVSIIAFCFMPNHFHLLLEQKMENGISIFLSNFQNSYTRYMNTRHNGIGPLLQGQFKAVHIQDDNQLLHVHRYTHLNPYTSYVVKGIEDLTAYPWSSLSEYLGNSHLEICDKEIILSHFSAKKSYQSFIFDQADYQRELDLIKHLTLEEQDFSRGVNRSTP